MSAVRVGAVTFDWYPFDPLVRRISEAAVDGGDEVDVICLRQESEQKSEVYNGVRIFRLPMNRGFGQSLPLTLLSWAWFMLIAGWVLTLRHLRRRYDVIHVHNIPDFLVFSALIPRLLGAKVILHVQDTAPELMVAKASGRKGALIFRLACWQERISCAFAHSVVTVGWPFEELLLQRGVPKEKITIILNSADPKLFPEERRCTPPYTVAERTGQEETTPFIIMYHGTLAERNGMDISIRALAQARQTVPQLRLDIKGRGEHLVYLKQLAQELGVQEHVVFTDPCAMEELVDFLLQGDVGIIPYRCNGFSELVLPTKAYEYAWMQRPMLASDTKAIRSMFGSESLILCDPERVESFAQAMIDLYQQPELRERLVTNALEDYTPYRWDAMAQRYRQLLRTLSGKSSPKGATKEVEVAISQP
ncbi:hypothetical protein KSD_37390 [Ktedonobacter sp. SOSP1-85]|uniref:glycosyltransferase family 4 protein n=1 Tax=Ktedonobacter sp. SOSP1-85 TaxID=2778367 RepID=UPI00191530CA|nr:glycosyltransferase family 4 protein [Ktedonobacter sp. SOSP1-85]GHO75968.1 hypothetical protein KSD_37390 [Ktedonobacter sp. SOSP1-85]